MAKILQVVYLICRNLFLKVQLTTSNLIDLVAWNQACDKQIPESKMIQLYRDMRQ